MHARGDWGAILLSTPVIGVAAILLGMLFLRQKTRVQI